MRTAKWLVIVFVAAAVAAGLYFFQQSAPDYIFLITLDTTRADRIDYSASGSTTPNLARLAQEGTVFTNAFSLIPITLPSHHSIFRSQAPHNLKIYNNGQRVQVDAPSIAGILKDNGYTTGAVVSLGVLKKDFGLADGFDYYIENFKHSLWHRSAEEVNGDAMAMIKKIKAEKDKAFIWLHYSDPHSPYFPPDAGGRLTVMGDNYDITQEPLVKQKLVLKPGETVCPVNLILPDIIEDDPRITPQYYELFKWNFNKISGSPDVRLKLPAGWRESQANGKNLLRFNDLKNNLLFFNPGREDAVVEFSFVFKMIFSTPANRLLYKRSVVYMDKHLGRLIDFLKADGVYDRSAFVLVGDHGEGLGEHKFYFGHIHYLNKNYLHVPLLVAGPMTKDRGTRQEAVSVLDVAPTVLDIAGIQRPDSMAGRSLLDNSTAGRILQETYSPEAAHDSFAIIEYPYQLIYTPGRKNPKERTELYNLAQDPNGTKNLFFKKGLSDIKGSLYNSIRKLSKTLSESKGEIGAMSEKHKEILETLGYF